MSTTADTTTSAAVAASAASATATATAAEAAKQVTAGFAYALDNVPDVAKPVVGKQRNPSMNKVGHKCCGGCCDVRRAVIIVNSINVAFGILALFGLAISKHVANNAYSSYSGNTYENEDGSSSYYDEDLMEKLRKTNWVWIFIVAIVRLLILIGGLYGGLKYHVPLISTCGFLYVVDGIFSIIALDFWGLLTSVLFAYPHYFLVQEIRQGIMTPENYHNEEHSCCCV
jgi:hypothetical protein